MKSWQYNGESSSSSNLSAFAPPFTVSPFAPNSNSNPYEPLLGLPSNSSLGSWVSSNPQVSAPDWAPNLMGREFNPISYPSEHEYLPQAAVPAVTEPFSYGQFPDGPRTNVDEVRPYYPQYYYKRIESEEPSGFTSQLGFDGLCDDKDQSVSRLDCLAPAHIGKTSGERGNREHHEMVNLEAGYCTELGNAAGYHSYMNQGAGEGAGAGAGAGAHPSIGFPIYAEASYNGNLFEMGKHDGPKCQEISDAKSFSADNPDFMVRNPPTTLNSKYTSVLPAAHSGVPSLDLFSDLRKDQKKHTSRVDISPAVSTRPPASAPVFEVLSKNHGDRISAGEHFSGNTPCSVMETRAAENTERNILFDAEKIRLGQARNECSLGKLKDEDLWSNQKIDSNDASVRPVRGIPGPEVSSMNAYGSNVSSFEAFNHFNHAVDSPCWKGVPIAHFGSSLLPSDIVPPEHPAEVYGLNPQKHQVFARNADSALKMSSQRLNESIPHRENQSWERNSMFHQEQPFDFNPAGTEQSIQDAVEVGSPHLIRQKTAHSNELRDDCSFEPSRTQQNNSEREVRSEERKLTAHERSDMGRNTSDDSNNVLSDVSFRCVEHVLSSPPSLREAAKHKEWYREELTPKIDVAMVVKTMHNLSELLLFCSSNGACDLTEQDCEFLQNATNNLVLFCLENKHLVNGRNSKGSTITFMPEEIFHGEFPGLHATLVEMKRPEQIGEVHTDQGKGFLIPPFVGGVKKHRVPNNPNNTSPEIPVVIGNSDVIGDDKMAQSGVEEGPQVSGDSGKSVCLNDSEKQQSPPDQPCESSSDHSSLSALPESIKDDKMTQAIKTILAENFHEEEEAEAHSQLFKNLWLEAEAALCSMNYRARYDRMKFEMEKLKSQYEKGPSNNPIAVKDLSNSGFFADSRAKVKSTDDVSKSRENLDISVQNLSPVNDVMARFNILKGRDSKSNPGNTLAGPKVLYDLNKADGFASEMFESPASPVITISPTKGLTHQADNVESSVLSRFSIQKQRDGSSSSVVNLEPDLSQDISGGSLVDQENSMNPSVWGKLSILKQREDHLSASEMEEKKAPEALSPESSILSRLSILKQRNDNLSSTGWDCSPLDAVDLESVVKKDYFPPVGERIDTPQNLSSGFTNYGVPDSQRTGDSQNLKAGLFSDLSTASEWEHVLKEEV